MPKVVLASALARWLPSGAGANRGEVSLDVLGGTVGEALDVVFTEHPTLRGYVLDEHGTVRHHVAIFVDGEVIANKRDLSSPVGPRTSIYILQALSGG